MSPFNINNDDKPRGRGCQEGNITSALRMYRLLRGVTQDELARLSGVDRSIISRVENGYRDLTEEQRASIAEALEADEEVLFR